MTNKEYNKTYYLKHKEQMLKSQKMRDSLRISAISKTKAEYYQKTKEIKKAYSKNYRKTYPGKVNALNAKHHAEKLQRTPKWLTKEHLNQIEKFYETAQILTKVSGIKFVVDHIMPLKGKNLSGLHVPWNLQILTWDENSKKSNKVVFK